VKRNRNETKRNRAKRNRSERSVTSCHNFWTNYLITLKFELDLYFMVPNTVQSLKSVLKLYHSFLHFQLPYPSIFATCYQFPEIFTSFPFPPNRANSPFYPSVRLSSQLLKRWTPWLCACGLVSPFPSLKTFLRFTPPAYKEESSNRYICI
jgi:hypothetical protein